jgi:hypothetical protein
VLEREMAEDWVEEERGSSSSESAMLRCLVSGLGIIYVVRTL